MILGSVRSGHGDFGDISVNVPLQHWSYEFIERFEARGALRNLGDGIKPLSRLAVARALVAIAAAGEKDLELSQIEKGELAFLEEEFNAELSQIGKGKKFVSASFKGRIKSGRPLWVYRHAQGEALADLRIRQQSDFFTGRSRHMGEQIFRHRLGGSVRGHFDRKIGFYIGFEQTREQGNRNYILRDDVYERRLEAVQLKGNLADYHQAKSYFVFALPIFRLELGKGEVSWGPAPEDNLGLSSNAPSFDMVRLQARYGAFKLVSIAGFLRPCPDRGDTPLCRGLIDIEESYIVNGIDRRLDREKYIAAHRFEVALFPWFDLGFQEVVVYGDRGPKFTYLNPLMFYQAAQSYQGDKDNLMMGLDLDLRPGRGVKFYLALVVDDLKKMRLFSNDYVNKFSLQTGVLWADPLGLRDLDFRAEYVRIEPWVFSHKIPVSTFRHFDSPLGHSRGSNSDRWSLQFKRRLAPGMSVRGVFHQTRHGDNEILPDGSIRNVGGDLHLGRRLGDETETKKFLAGVLSKWTGVGGMITWRIWPLLAAEVGCQVEWGNNVPLPPRWGRNVARRNRTGYGSGREEHFSFELRYSYY